MKNYRFFPILLGLLCVFVFQSVSAQEPLSRQIQNIKREVLDLNRDLTLLEEELLYPSSQTSFYVSVDVGTPIRLVDVNMALDGYHLAYHFYTEQEFDALTKGGVHELYRGNIKSGPHKLEITITGYDPQGKDYRKTTTYEFKKGPGRKNIELRVVDDLDSMQHKFQFNEWDQQ